MSKKKQTFKGTVYVAVIDDCISSRIVYERVCFVICKNFPNLQITKLDLYDVDDAAKADILGIFDAPCIVYENNQLQGLVSEEVILKFLKYCISDD